VSGLGKKLVLSIVALGMLGCVGGCGKKQITPPQMTFTIKSDSETNDGQPFYVLFRAVNEAEFVTDSYQDIAKMVFADPPDASFLGTQVVVPGQKKKIKVEQPMKNTVGVYGLYSEPAEHWRVMLSKPLSSKYVIVFEKNEMTAKKKKGLLRRCLFF
jgi:hypothetical protein